MAPEGLASEVEIGIPGGVLVVLRPDDGKILAEAGPEFRREGDQVALQQSRPHQVQHGKQHDRLVRPLVVTDDSGVEVVEEFLEVLNG